MQEPRTKMKPYYYHKKLHAYELPAELTGSETAYGIRIIGKSEKSFLAEASTGAISQVGSDFMDASLFLQAATLAKRIHKDYQDTEKHIPLKKFLEL